ncbi:MAG: hypothetical protein AAFV69_09685 [Pseudomonadota bacterium]
MIFAPASKLLEEVRSSDDPVEPGDVLALVKTQVPELQPPIHTIGPDDLKAARDEGYASGLAAASSKHEVEMQERYASWTAELDVAKSEWEAAAGVRLAGSMAQQLDALRNELSEQAAAVLQSFIGRTIQKEAVEELAKSVEDMINDTETIAIELTGPSALIDGFCSNFTAAVQLNAVIDETAAELRVRVQSTTFATRITEWIHSLEAPQTCP